MPQSAAQTADDSAPRPDLAAVRAEIDRLDNALLDLMEQRLALSMKVAEAKRTAQSGPTSTCAPTASRT